MLVDTLFTDARLATQQVAVGGMVENGVIASR